MTPIDVGDPDDIGWCMINGKKLITKLIKTNGKIDKEATLKSVSDIIDSFIDAKKIETAIIASAVEEVFNSNNGAEISLYALKTFATTTSKLKTAACNHSVIINRIYEYIRENSQGKNLSKTETPIWERPNSLFIVKKGKSIMVRRRKDLK